MKKLQKLVAGGLSLALLAALAAVAACEKDPFPDGMVFVPQYTVNEADISGDANNKALDPENIELRESPLAGKTIYWLGSSVTVGHAAGLNGVADYLTAITGSINVKEAVNRTTLLTAEGSNNSYVMRMLNGTNFDKEAKIDAFICQISTNDATEANKPQWGSLTAADVTELSAFDLSTTMGGVEYIVNYVTQTWNCPVYFYSGSYFGDDGVRSNKDPSGTNYGQLVDLVKTAVKKYAALDGYEVEVIDLFNDEDFNSVISDDYWEWCMQDAVHPKRAGYLNWWTPYFAAFLETRLNT